MFDGNKILPARIVEWDSAFFGLPIARLDALDGFSYEQISTTLNNLRSNDFKLLYLFAKQEDQKTFDNAVRAGGSPMGSRVVFMMNIKDRKKTKEESRIIEYNHRVVESELLKLALLSGAHSRFNLDENLPKGSFERLYETWISRSVKREIAQNVLVHHSPMDQITGLITLGRADQVGDIGLLSVDPQFQGKSIGTKLINEAVNYFIGQNLSQLQVVTQGNNKAAVNFYTRLGFHKESEYNIFHFWL